MHENENGNENETENETENENEDGASVWGRTSVQDDISAAADQGSRPRQRTARTRPILALVALVAPLVPRLSVFLSRSRLPSRPLPRLLAFPPPASSVSRVPLGDNSVTGETSSRPGGKLVAVLPGPVSPKRGSLFLSLFRFFRGFSQPMVIKRHR